MASSNVVFTDVDPDAWYGEAVAWATGEGIVTGNSSGFAPDAPVTREQLAVMLYRYADAVGCDDGSWGSLSTFRDRGEISDWAEEAMSWAVGSGLMEGRDGRYLAHQETASRAEVAAILMRMMPMLV